MRSRWRRPAARRCWTCTARCCGRASASAPTATGERGRPSGAGEARPFPRVGPSARGPPRGALSARRADAEVQGFPPAWCTRENSSWYRKPGPQSCPAVATAHSRGPSLAVRFTSRCLHQPLCSPRCVQLLFLAVRRGL